MVLSAQLVNKSRLIKYTRVTLHKPGMEKFILTNSGAQDLSVCSWRQQINTSELENGLNLAKVCL